MKSRKHRHCAGTDQSISAYRNPEFRLHRSDRSIGDLGKFRGRYPDDRKIISKPPLGDARAFQINRLADDVWVAVKAPSPEIMVQNNDMVLSRSLFFWTKALPHDWREAERLKEICSDESPLNGFEVLATAGCCLQENCCSRSIASTILASPGKIW